MTIAGDVNFTHYDLFQQGGNTVFDGATYTGDTFAVMGYRYRGQSMSYGTAAFDSGSLTTTIETAAGYNSTGTIDWNSPGTLSPGALLAVGDGGSGVFAQTRGTVDTAASGCTLSFGSSGTSAATNAYNLDGGALETGSLVAYRANSQFNMAGGTFAPASPSPAACPTRWPPERSPPSTPAAMISSGAAAFPAAADWPRLVPGRLH